MRFLRKIVPCFVVSMQYISKYQSQLSTFSIKTPNKIYSFSDLYFLVVGEVVEDDRPGETAGAQLLFPVHVFGEVFALLRIVCKAPEFGEHVLSVTLRQLCTAPHHASGKK